MIMILVRKDKESGYRMNEYGSSQTIRANNPRSNLENLRFQMKAMHTPGESPMRGLHSDSNSISSEFDLKQIRWKSRLNV